MRGTELGSRMRRKGRRAYLVAKTLRGNNSDFIADALVGLEIEGEFGVITFDDDFGRLLDGLQDFGLVSLPGQISD